MAITHYFLYIKAGVLLDAHTRFFKVGFGESDTHIMSYLNGDSSPAGAFSLPSRIHVLNQMQ